MKFILSLLLLLLATALYAGTAPCLACHGASVGICEDDQQAENVTMTMPTIPDLKSVVAAYGQIQSFIDTSEISKPTMGSYNASSNRAEFSGYGDDHEQSYCFDDAQPTAATFNRGRMVPPVRRL